MRFESYNTPALALSIITCIM